MLLGVLEAQVAPVAGLLGLVAGRLAGAGPLGHLAVERPVAEQRPAVALGAVGVVEDLVAVGRQDDELVEGPLVAHGPRRQEEHADHADGGQGPGPSAPADAAPEQQERDDQQGVQEQGLAPGQGGQADGGPQQGRVPEVGPVPPPVGGQHGQADHRRVDALGPQGAVDHPQVGVDGDEPGGEQTGPVAGEAAGDQTGDHDDEHSQDGAHGLVGQVGAGATEGRHRQPGRHQRGVDRGGDGIALVDPAERLRVADPVGQHVGLVVVEERIAAGGVGAVDRHQGQEPPGEGAGGDHRQPGRERGEPAVLRRPEQAGLEAAEGEADGRGAEDGDDHQRPELLRARRPAGPEQPELGHQGDGDEGRPGGPADQGEHRGPRPGGAPGQAHQGQPGADRQQDHPGEEGPDRAAGVEQAAHVGAGGPAQQGPGRHQEPDGPPAQVDEPGEGPAVPVVGDQGAGDDAGPQQVELGQGHRAEDGAPLRGVEGGHADPDHQAHGDEGHAGDDGPPHRVAPGPAQRPLPQRQEQGGGHDGGDDPAEGQPAPPGREAPDQQPVPDHDHPRRGGGVAGHVGPRRRREPEGGDGDEGPPGDDQPPDGPHRGGPQVEGGGGIERPVRHPELGDRGADDDQDGQAPVEPPQHPAQCGAAAARHRGGEGDRGGHHRAPGDQPRRSGRDGGGRRGHGARSYGPAPLRPGTARRTARPAPSPAGCDRSSPAHPPRAQKMFWSRSVAPGFSSVTVASTRS